MESGSTRRHCAAKQSSATLEDVGGLDENNVRLRVNGQRYNPLRFVDDIILVTPSISEAERMLTDVDDVCAEIGLQLILTKTVFMRNG
ncbi:hypothetical protein Y032_0264g634 [Ancylostoma ceylanicum]|uniref:Reverse transcriptase domain-containing protein n=1 Tax=Ancylostoma ceylanicum TaxID=53326 RepID=A0A016S9M2_9BILA|nr:hypothetical protein Y032_0264g634 [Ancylostoma ceylanicum]